MSYLLPAVDSIERCDAPASCRSKPSRTDKLKPGAKAKSRKSAARAALPMAGAEYQTPINFMIVDSTGEAASAQL
jgi:hypothetical protein